MSSSFLRSSVLSAILWWGGGLNLMSAPHQATGFKVGEVSADHAIVWTRLTKNPTRNSPGSGILEIQFKEGGNNPKTAVTGVTFPPGKSADDIDYEKPFTPSKP